MGVLEEVDRQSRRGRIRMAAALAAAILVAVGAGLWWLRRDQVPLPEKVPATFEEWDALLGKLVALPAKAAAGPEVGAELEQLYYYPQFAGMKSFHAEFQCPFVLVQMKYWMPQNNFSQEEIDAAHLKVVADWSAKSGLSVNLEGWPDQLQPLEKKRHTDILRDLVELMVPPPESVVLSLYDVTVRQTSWAAVVFGRKRSQEAPLDSFRKIYYKDGSYTFVEGVGPQASFKTVQRYGNFEGRRVILEQKYRIVTEAAGLHYVVTPFYETFEGIVIPVRFHQTYTGEAGDVLTEPLDLEGLKVEVFK